MKLDRMNEEDPVFITIPHPFFKPRSDQENICERCGRLKVEHRHATIKGEAMLACPWVRLFDR